MDKLKVAIAALALAVTATLSSQPSPAMMQATAWTDTPGPYGFIRNPATRHPRNPGPVYHTRRATSGKDADHEFNDNKQPNNRPRIELLNASPEA